MTNVKNHAEPELPEGLSSTPIEATPTYRRRVALLLSRCYAPELVTDVVAKLVGHRNGAILSSYVPKEGKAAPLRHVSLNALDITRHYIESAKRPRAGELRHAVATRHFRGAMAQLVDVDVSGKFPSPSGSLDASEGSED